VTKSARSTSSWKTSGRSIPRTMTWWRVFDASRRDWRDMVSVTLALLAVLGNASPSRKSILFGNGIRVPQISWIGLDLVTVY
jgi:hypothetical protein